MASVVLSILLAVLNTGLGFWAYVLGKPDIAIMLTGFAMAGLMAVLISAQS